MEYLNLKMSTLGDIRYIGSTPLLRATWLNLLAYCAKMENSGIIENCAQWGDGTWVQIAGLKKREVHAASTLWEWQGENLLVWGYPLENQRICLIRREIGRNGGLASGSSRRSSKREPNGSAIGEAIGSPNGSSLVERNRIEDKGKELERERTRARAGEGESVLQADAIAAIYCRQDSPMLVRECLLDDLTGGTSVTEIREGVQRCMAFIRSAPGGSSNRFVPTARKFFELRQWRSPEAFQERWKKDSGDLTARKAADEIPTSAKATQLKIL